MSNHQHQVFITGFCAKQYTQNEMSAILKTTLPGFKSVIVPKNLYNGFAFLELESSSAKKELLNKKQLKIEGNYLIVKEVKKGKDLYNDRKETLNRKIFISNIPKKWSDQELEECFSRFGELEEAYACKDKRRQNKRRRVGFAVYKDPECAGEVASLQVVGFRGEKVNVEPAFDVRKGAVGGHPHKQKFNKRGKNSIYYKKNKFTRPQHQQRRNHKKKKFNMREKVTENSHHQKKKKFEGRTYEEIERYEVPVPQNSYMKQPSFQFNQFNEYERWNSGYVSREQYKEILDFHSTKPSSSDYYEKVTSQESARFGNFNRSNLRFNRGMRMTRGKVY